MCTKFLVIANGYPEWEIEHTSPSGVVPPPVTHCKLFGVSGAVINSIIVASITYNTKLLEAAEIMGIDPSVAIACLYQIQSRGDATDDLQTLMEEVNKYKLQSRECTVCLSNPVNSLILPCR